MIECRKYIVINATFVRCVDRETNHIRHTFITDETDVLTLPLWYESDSLKSEIRLIGELIESNVI